jgi:SSS family solute:Na+ symporter
VVPVTLAIASLGAWDWLVLVIYFAALGGAGFYFARRGAKTEKDYFLAERSMPAWAVAISLLATMQSAATFVGVPQQGFGGNLTYLSANIGVVVGGVIVAAFFLPLYYRLNVGTPYEFLEARFGRPARVSTSVTYLIGRVMASGSRLYIGAVPFALAAFGKADGTTLLISIALFMVFGCLFTLLGGVRSVIWTDVIQVGVYLGAALVLIFVLLHKIPASPGEIYHALLGSGKLTVLTTGLEPTVPGATWGFNPANQFTLLTALTGFTLLNTAALGMDQDLTQRTLTCRSAWRAGLSVVAGSLVVTLPVLVVFFALGLLLHVFYARPDLMGGHVAPAPSGDSTDALVDFSLSYSPAGVAGLMIAGLLAAGPAGINASLNSMASSFVGDIYKTMRPGRGDRHYLRTGRLASIGAGVAISAFAALCVAYHNRTDTSFLDLALNVMTFAYAGLLGVFLTGVFTRRGNSASAIGALVSGFLVVLLLQDAVWKVWTPGVPRLHGVTLSDLKLAFPWRLVIGTLVATGVCLLGSPRRRPRDDDNPQQSTP